MGTAISGTDKESEREPEVYKYTYRASSLGGCIKSLIAARSGYEPLDVYSGMTVLEEGNLHEPHIIERLRTDGWIISRQQEECERVLAGFGVNITGHNDGIIQLSTGDDYTTASDPLVLEIKTMGDASFKDWKRRGWSNPGLMQKYKWQVSFYMHCYAMPLMFVVKNRNSGEMDTDFVREPFYSWSDIVNRITQIEIAARNSDLPELCDSPMYPCPFNYLHEEAKDDTIAEAGDELSGLVAEYILKRDKRDELVNECKVILGEIKEKADGKKVSFPFASYTEASVRRVSYDYDKMRGDGIDVEKYEKVTFTTTPKVTKKKVKEGEADVQAKE